MFLIFFILTALFSAFLSFGRVIKKKNHSILIKAIHFPKKKKKKKEQQSTYRAKEPILGYTAVKMLIARPH